MTETKARAGEGLSPAQTPAAEAKAAMTGFLTEFNRFQDEVKSTLKHQEERLTMLNAKTMSYGRPALSARAEVEAPHQKAFNAYLRTGDDDGLRGLTLEGKAMSTAVAADGGYLVDPQTSERIQSLLLSTSSLRSIANVVQVEATSFDVIVDRYFEVTDEFDDRLDTLEEAVFGDDGQGGVPRDVFAIRRDLMEFRRAAAPIRDVVNAIIRREVSFVSDEAIVHFHDIYDRVLRIVDLVESQRDLLTGLLEADLAVISNRLNQVMKKMTSWGAILIVATLVAGIYGMNFRYMPELDWHYGYFFALGTMLVSTGGLYLYFKRKSWL